MNTFNSRRVDKDLEQRSWPRNLRNVPRRQLEAEVALGFAVLIQLIEVCPHGRFDQVQVTTKDAVLVQYGNLIQACKDGLLQTLLFVEQVIRRQFFCKVETRTEIT